MRSSRITTLILCILISASQAQANKTQNTTEAISVTDGASRHYLTLEEEVNEIVLQDLKRGETYKIFINGEQEGCQPFYIFPEIETGLVLEFEAETTTELIQLGKTCNTSLDIRFSIGCTSCEEDYSSRNMMGIMVDEFYTPEQLVQDVFIGGDCFDVESGSISFTGDERGSALFTNGTSSINIEEGVLLSTGNVHNSAGPNDFYNTGSSFFNFGTDPDLSLMVGSNFMYDVSALEFDFTPTTDQISFEFVFASEEYCEYVNSSFNDAFGFFISGPGINGPFSNNAENIAVVPNTASYTSINAVNHLDNPAYFVNNIPIAQHADIPTFLQCLGYPTTEEGVAVSNIEYDGFTTVMTAMANVQACETYHIKLVIADVADGYFDSAVFLKANSFSSGDLANISTEAPGGGADANIAYENCEDGYFIFERASDDLTQDLVVNYSLSPLSTATPGIDYEPLPTSVTIPAGDSLFYLPVTVYDDLFTELSESIVLQLDAPCSCDIPYVQMYIEDVEPLAVVADDVFFCDPAPVSIQPLITGGWGNYTYLWNTGDTTAMLDSYVESDSTFSVVVFDECGNSLEHFINVGITEAPTAIISGDELVCSESPNAQIQIDFSGPGPWDIVYTIDNIPQPVITGIVDNPYILETINIGSFELQSVVSFDCSGTVQGLATVTAVDLNIDLVASDETCPGAEDGTISTSPSGGAEPYSFSWDNGIGNIQDPIDLPAGTYELILSDNNGCTTSAQVEVELDPNVPMANAGLDDLLDCNNMTLSLSATASMGSNFSYQWTTIDGNIFSGGSTLTPVVDQNGTYQLNVMNVNTNCVVTDDAEVFIDTISPVAAIDVLGPLTLDCGDPMTVLDGSGSAPFGDLVFSWATVDGNILGDPMAINPEVNAAGTYELLVTSNTNGCTDTETFYIDANIELPQVLIQPAGLLNCFDSIVTLQAGNSSSGTNYTVLWTTADGNIINGVNTLSPTVDQPGNYELTIFNTSNDCSNTTSVVVAEDRITPIADAGLPTELDCNDTFTTLSGSEASQNGDFIFEWSTNDGFIQNGINTLNPEATIAGTYTLLITNIRNGCTDSDATIVIENPNVPNAADIEIFEPECFGDNGGVGIISVVGGEAPYVYSIDGGENFFNQNLFLGLEPGNYNVVIQDDGGCLYEEQINIPAPLELLLDIIQDVEITLGETYQLDATVNIPTAFLDTIIWSPEETLSCNDCLDPVAYPLQTTTYQIMVTDENGCPAIAEIQVRVDKSRKIFIPNAFSPNADGANDRFMIYAKEGQVVNISTFQVFNRWGGKVFETKDAMPNDPSFGWDGTMKGETVNPAVFIYFAEIEFIDGEKVLFKGDITVTD